jgi:two-component system C4-dicarboxylate transport response regulator DctD
LQNVALRYAMGLGLDIPGSPSLAMDVAGSGATLADQLAAVERQIIATVLRQHGGSLKATYEALGVSRKTLYDKIRKLGLAKLTPEDDGDEV